MSFFTDVRQWHRKMELVEDGPPRLPSPALWTYRNSCHQEELWELNQAIEGGDLAEVADAIGDLIWFLCGTADHLGIDLDLVWEEIKRANYAKILAEPSDLKHKRGSAERIRKPDGWQPPDIATAIALMEKRYADRD